MGLYVVGFSVTDPNSHPVQSIVEGVGVVLMVLGGLALVLSGFLIVNMMNALVTQQVWQIGVMKVVGATRGRIMRVYLATALLYGLLALLLAVPAGALAAYVLTAVLLNIFNVAAGSFGVMPQALAIQIVAGLAVPLLAALVPVLGGARITPHQAISNYGLGAGFGRSWLDRLIGGIQFLPRPLALSLRNTFRRKPRIALTLITLVLGGIMFMVVMSVGTSLNNTIEVVLDDFGFDALVVFRRAYRVQRLVEVARAVPDVTGVEVWHVQSATLELPSGEDLDGQLWGVPTGSQMFRPRIIQGRDFLPGEGRVMLLNSKIAADEGIALGDEVTLTIGDEESTWKVVGLVVNINNLQRDNFVPFEALSREMGSYDQGALVMVTFNESSSTSQGQLVRDVREAYGTRNMPPVIIQTGEQVRQSNKMVFNAITYLFLVMALLAALVGSVGLMSTMSINVSERSREIGVMRAIGARSLAVLGVFVVEGMLVGVLSWFLAVPLSYPGSLAFNHLVSESLFSLPLDLQYSLGGAILWLAIVVVLSALASLWPAMRATQVSVRESLAYE
jgi:putative ABC transport system permease protein